MKNLYKLLSVIVLGLIISQSTFAQDKECKLDFDFSADLVSRYIWRGTDFGNTPSVQPGFALSYGGLEVGAWGNYGLSSNTGSLEMDLFAGYSTDFGLGILFTDYYFPGEGLVSDGVNITPMRMGNYFDFENAHTFEFGLTYEIKGISVEAYYMIEGDMYFQAGYAFDKVNLFVGAGDGAYTVDEDFGICNVGIGYEKEVKITDNYSLPLFGQFIVNPSSEQVHLVFGLSF